MDKEQIQNRIIALSNELSKPCSHCSKDKIHSELNELRTRLSLMEETERRENKWNTGFIGEMPELTPDMF